MNPFCFIDPISYISLINRPLQYDPIPPISFLILSIMFCCQNLPKNPSIQKNDVTLLIIDAQNDFHPGENNSLPVTGANEDSTRIANLILSSLDKPSSPIDGSSSTTSDIMKNVTIDSIVVTLDSHNKLHIAHPGFWIHAETGKHPEPFTTIESTDIENGIWKPSEEAFHDNKDSIIDFSCFQGGKESIMKDGKLDLVNYCIQYAQLLENGGKFKLLIWPEHCLIGSGGNKVVDVIQNALDEWEMKHDKKVMIQTKGEENLTEMYSALKSEVPISKATAFNEGLFRELNKSSKIIVCGEAKSHCVNYTVMDLLGRMNEEDRKKVYLLSDCASPVTGFENAAVEFEENMKKVGAHVIKFEEVENIFTD